MTTQIRHGVFETNSSSTHSISIAGAVGVCPEACRLKPDDDGVLRLETGEFGWEIADYRDPWTKAAYAATFVMNLTAPEQKYDDPHLGRESLSTRGQEQYEMLVTTLKEHTGAKEVVIEKSSDRFNPYGDIDHQSFHVAADAFESSEQLAAFILNDESTLHTDNDNH